MKPAERDKTGGDHSVRPPEQIIHYIYRSSDNEHTEKAGCILSCGAADDKGTSEKEYGAGGAEMDI